MSIQGSPTAGIRWIIDSSGAIVGYRNPITDQDAAAEFGGSGGGGIIFPSPVLSASAVVKGVAGDPGDFISIFCTSVSGGKVTIRDGGSVAGALIPGLGGGGASGLALTAGQYLSLGAPVYCANGIYLEISGTVSVVVLYQ